LSQQFIE